MSGEEVRPETEHDLSEPDAPPDPVLIPVRQPLESEDDGAEEPEESEAGGNGPPTFVTMLAPIELQIGQNIVTALRREDVVGVVTTVMEGEDGLQRIISVGLSAEQLGEIQRMIERARRDAPRSRVPCLGFHCVLQERETTAGGGTQPIEPGSPEG
ncbi:MAG: hypothetical protein KF817_07070 [Phycisphaeraceae bacterium]|nr:hypothetical protein [Phycisphaeraceae bacterium]